MSKQDELLDVLLEVYNDGFVYGELGTGKNDQESTGEAIAKTKQHYREAVEGAGLTDEEIKDIKLTQEECRELMAKSAEYKPREFRGLYENEEHRLMLERKIAEAQTQAILKALGGVNEMANEQELLSDEEFRKTTGKEIYDRITIKEVAQAQVAKLKALGYEQVWIKCPDCHNGQMPETGRGSDGFIRCEICKGTGKITNKER